MIKTNYHVFLRENTLKALVSKDDMLYSFRVAKECPYVVEFFHILLFDTTGRSDIDKHVIVVQEPCLKNEDKEICFDL